MDNRNRECVHCGNEFEPDPRVKGQRYCGKEDCQLARRTIWQRDKMQKDADYGENQKNCWKEWYSKHPGYYKEYRRKNPEKVKANRIRQKLRDMKRRTNGLDKLLAKMDVIRNRISPRKEGLYKLIPIDPELLAKMDVMTVQLVPL